MDYYMGCSSQGTLRMVNTYTLGIGSPFIGLLTKWTTSQFHTQRIIGAADSLRYMYEARINLLGVMRLDLLLSIIIAILSYGLNDHEQHLGYLTACVIFIVSLLKWLMGRTAVVKEIKAMVYVYVALSTLCQLWIPIQVRLEKNIFFICDNLVFLEQLILVSCYFPEKCSHSRIEFSYATVVACLSLIGVQVVSSIMLLKVFRNFGYGLTDRGKSISCLS
jgi:hypothetical protein